MEIYLPLVRFYRKSKVQRLLTTSTWLFLMVPRGRLELPRKAAELKSAVSTNSTIGAVVYAKDF